MTREEFLEKAAVAAQKASAKSGLPAGVTVAQAALESNWGESQLSKAANNYFGIKAHGKHAVMEFRTCEFGATGETMVIAKFAAYDSMEECFECRDSLITKGAVYADARAARNDIERFVSALGKHWATDPKYAEKVLRVYRECGLEKLDRS